MKTYFRDAEMEDSFFEYVDELNKDLDPDEPVFQQEIIEKFNDVKQSDEIGNVCSLKESYEVMQKNYRTNIICYI